MKLIPVSSADFRLASLIPKDAVLNSSQAAAVELIVCFDGVLAEMPNEFRDFILRFLKSCGMPLDYDELPFWTHKAALHVFTICYPTLRNSNFKHPSTGDFGRIAGHLWAIIRHAKEGSSFFEKFPEKTAKEFRAFCLRLEAPVEVLIRDGMHMPPHESEKFMTGMAHAYTRTFDLTGMPKGWNTTSRVYLGICISWRLIAAHALPFGKLHAWLEKTFGKQEIGGPERVKKICDRMGLKFTGSETSQETVEILAVRSAPKRIPDK